MNILFCGQWNEERTLAAEGRALWGYLAQNGCRVGYLVCAEEEKTETIAPNVTEYRYRAQLPPGVQKAMGEAPRQARRYELAVRRWMDENGAPALILLRGDAAAGYYLLQQRLCLDAALQNTKIVLHIGEAAAADLLREDEYQFPAYWHRRMRRAQVPMADAVVCGAQAKEHLLQLPGTEEGRIFPVSDIPQTLAAYQAIAASREERAHFPFAARHAVQAPLPGIPGERELLSVVVPYYNLGETIADTLKSLGAVTYSPTEIILVNDGSTDAASLARLEEMEKEYPDMRVLHIPNGGLAQARNVGAAAAKGEFVAFLDADDLVEAGYHRRCVQILRRYPNVGYVYSWARYFEGYEGCWVTYNAELPYLLLGNMPTSATVVRRDLFLAFGQNRPVMKHGLEDHDGWLGLAAYGHLGVCIPEPLFLYRIRKNSMFRSLGAETHLQMYRLLAEGHAALYREYAGDIFNLTVANGSPLHWINPSMPHSALGSRSAEALAEMEKAQEQLRQIHQSPSLFWRAVRAVWRRRARSPKRGNE